VRIAIGRKQRARIAIALCACALEKIPAAVWPLLIARSHDLAAPLARNLPALVRGCLTETIDAAIALPSRHRQQMWIFWLAMRPKTATPR